MTKKVGIVTITGGSNYGNKLQHYAVAKVLEKLGFQVETVQDETINGFATPAQKNSIWSKLNLAYLKKVIDTRMQYQYHRKNEADGYISCILRERKRHTEFVALEKKRKERFDTFTKKYLPGGNLFVSASKKADSKVVASFTGFVCGSDQVWNPNYRNTSSVKFLTFAPEYKRIALAPSFGVQEIPQTRLEAYTDYLLHMAHLSVREQSGADIIKKLTGRDALVLIDPTLMLTAEEWKNLELKPINFQDKSFLLTYFLGYKTNAYVRIINKIAAERNLKVINLFEITEAESYVYDPAEFLWLVHHADYICTDSFHGSVFSILFHKPFNVFSRSENGFADDSRVGNLLKILGLRNNLKPGETYTENEYTEAENRLTLERDKFKNYLQSALTEAEKAGQWLI